MEKCWTSPLKHLWNTSGVAGGPSSCFTAKHLCRWRHLSPTLWGWVQSGKALHRNHYGWCFIMEARKCVYMCVLLPLIAVWAVPLLTVRTICPSFHTHSCCVTFYSQVDIFFSWLTLKFSFYLLVSSFVSFYRGLIAFYGHNHLSFSDVSLCLRAFISPYVRLLCEWRSISELK